LIDPSGLFLDDAFSSRPDVYGDMWKKEYGTPEPYPRLDEFMSTTFEFLGDMFIYILNPGTWTGTILPPDSIDKYNPFSPSPANACE